MMSLTRGRAGDQRLTGPPSNLLASDYTRESRSSRCSVPLAKKQKAAVAAGGSRKKK